MAETSNEKRVVILPDPLALAEAVASRFLSRIAKRSDHKRLVHISLTGGTMGAAVLKAAAANPRTATLDWSKVHFWWSDERWVPRADADRNEKQSREALLDQLEQLGFTNRLFARTLLSLNEGNFELTLANLRSFYNMQ